MTNKIAEKVIKHLCLTFSKKFEDFKGIYLFGAYLNDVVNEDEDIELIALFDIEDRSKREQIWPIIGKFETDMDVCIDLYPYTEETFKKDEDIYDEVMEEGIFYNTMGVKQEK